jgi:hypothetical protein
VLRYLIQKRAVAGALRSLERLAAYMLVCLKVRGAVSLIALLRLSRYFE